MLYETKFLISLILTIIIETQIVIFVIYLFKKKIDIQKTVFSAVLASALTLPYLWFILPPYLNVKNYIAYGEVLVVLAEALLYNKLLEIRYSQAFLISLTANAVSFLVGLLMF